MDNATMRVISKRLAYSLIPNYIVHESFVQAYSRSIQTIQRQGVEIAIENER